MSSFAAACRPHSASCTLDTDVGILCVEFTEPRRFSALQVTTRWESVGEQAMRESEPLRDGVAGRFVDEKLSSVVVVVVIRTTELHITSPPSLLLISSSPSLRSIHSQTSPRRHSSIQTHTSKQTSSNTGWPSSESEWTIPVPAPQ